MVKKIWGLKSKKKLEGLKVKIFIGTKIIFNYALNKYIDIIYKRKTIPLLQLYLIVRNNIHIFVIIIIIIKN